MEKASGKYENHSLLEYKIIILHISEFILRFIKKNISKGGGGQLECTKSERFSDAQKYDQSTENIGS